MAEYKEPVLKRLVDYTAHFYRTYGTVPPPCLKDAADEIERLRNDIDGYKRVIAKQDAELEKLRAELRAELEAVQALNGRWTFQ